MEIIKALYEPQHWPSLSGHIAALLNFTTGRVDWDICYEEPQSNLGASDIAKSVVLQDRLRSYVARGELGWMKEVFDKERSLLGV